MLKWTLTTLKGPRRGDNSFGRWCCGKRFLWIKALGTNLVSYPCWCVFVQRLSTFATFVKPSLASKFIPWANCGFPGEQKAQALAQTSQGSSQKHFMGWKPNSSWNLRIHQPTAIGNHLWPIHWLARQRKSPHVLQTSAIFILTKGWMWWNRKMCFDAKRFECSLLKIPSLAWIVHHCPNALRKVFQMEQFTAYGLISWLLLQLCPSDTTKGGSGYPRPLTT